MSAGYRLKCNGKWVRYRHQLGEDIWYEYDDLLKESTLALKDAKYERLAIAELIGIKPSAIEIVEFDDMFISEKDKLFAERRKKRGKLKDYLL